VSLPSVFGQIKLGKYVIGKELFIEYFLVFGKDFVKCQTTLDKLRITKNIKYSKTFFKSMEQLPEHRHCLAHHYIIFHLFFESNLLAL
jgi:hypothetical protein